MTKRSERYTLKITMKDGYEELGIFSQRPRAIKRADVIAKTWNNFSNVSVIDNWAWNSAPCIFSINNEKV